MKILLKTQTETVGDVIEEGGKLSGSALPYVKPMLERNPRLTLGMLAEILNNPPYFVVEVVQE